MLRRDDASAKWSPSIPYVEVSTKVSKAFAAKIISVPNDDARYPSCDQLLGAGVITATRTAPG